MVTDQQPFLPPEEVERWTQVMARQREELSDLDADTLDALSAIWLYQATDPNDAAVADVDDLLTLRGLVRNPGQERRGGYKAHQRMRMWQSLAHSEPLAHDGRTGDVRRRRHTAGQAPAQTYHPGDSKSGLYHYRFDGTVTVGQLCRRGSLSFALVRCLPISSPVQDARQPCSPPRHSSMIHTDRHGKSA